MFCVYHYSLQLHHVCTLVDFQSNIFHLLDILFLLLTSFSIGFQHNSTMNCAVLCVCDARNYFFVVCCFYLSTFVSDSAHKHLFYAFSSKYSIAFTF